VIPVPDTVVDVRAVMVKPLYASVADVAVTAPRGPDDLALRTEIEGVGLDQGRLKVNLRISAHVARI